MLERQRFRGCLLGLAAGDALGTTVEFSSPGSFAPLTGIIGSGPFQLKPGEWTDDTSMALCLAESLVEKGFDELHQLETYCRWWQHGHLSVKGRCFDIGNQTRASLATFRQAGKYTARQADNSAGNGSIMRLAPVPMRYAANAEQAVEFAAKSSLTTHGATECVDACRYLAGLIVGALQGRPKDELLSPLFSPVPGLFEKVPLTPKIRELAAGSFKLKDPPQIVGSGYVVKSLEAALWAFHRSNDFRSGALLAVNLGDDADTTGAVYGQIAGAFYGEAGIPAEWRAKLAMRELIEQRADELYGLAAGG
ncbi:MAG: ADP-ribosylglycohydrolase family protein [Gemmataceae bacterium]